MNFGPDFIDTDPATWPALDDAASAATEIGADATRARMRPLDALWLALAIVGPLAAIALGVWIGCQ